MVDDGDALRDAVGPESSLMVDAGASDAFWPQDYKWAMRTARMLADYNVRWFEEPLVPDNLHDYVLLRNNAPVPIAGGAKGPIRLVKRLSTTTQMRPGEQVPVAEVDLSGWGGKGVLRLWIRGQWGSAGEATVRMGGNFGFEIYVVSDGCFAVDKKTLDGRVFSAEDVHALSLANMSGEYATVALGTRSGRCLTLPVSPSRFTIPSCWRGSGPC